MTEAEIREALARAERATCSCHIEITRVHGFPQGHRSDCARTDVPRLAADLLAARAERDEERRCLLALRTACRPLCVAVELAEGVRPENCGNHTVTRLAVDPGFYLDNNEIQTVVNVMREIEEGQ